MNVNTKSWHYRFNVWRTNMLMTKRKNTLCSYFWFTVFNMAFISFISGVVIGIVYMLGYSFHDTVLIQYGWDFISMPFYVSIPVIFFSGVIIVSIVVLLALFLFFVGSCAVHIFNKIKTVYSDSKKEPGLVMSYIKAKKSKICPIIEFKD